MAVFCYVCAFFGSPLKFELIYAFVQIYVLLNRSQKKKKKKIIELLITFQMETTLDFNSDISNMDGLKSECLENTIDFVFL